MTKVVLPEGNMIETGPGTVEEILFRLGFNPYEVLATADGSPALFKVLDEGKIPDAILLDMFFPDESGLDILRSLKEKYPQIKVLVITGMNKQSLNKEIIESGANDILYKPFDMEDLTLALKKLAK